MGSERAPGWGDVMDLTQFHALFFDESAELLSEAQASLVRWSDAPPPIVLETVYRCAHTIKGGGRTFGFEAIAALAEALERVVSEQRRNGAGSDVNRVRSVCAGAVDCLLGAFSCLRGGEPADEAAMSAITGQLRALLAEQPTSPDVSASRVAGEVPMPGAGARDASMSGSNGAAIDRPAPHVTGGGAAKGHVIGEPGATMPADARDAFDDADAGDAEGASPYLVFCLADVRYAGVAERVEEVARDPGVRAVVGFPEGMGLAEVGGRGIPVLDILAGRACRGGPLIVLRHQGGAVGLRVDEVERLVHLAPSEIVPVHPLLGEPGSPVLGTAKASEVMLVVIDFDLLVRDGIRDVVRRDPVRREANVSAWSAAPAPDPCSGALGGRLSGVPVARDGFASGAATAGAASGESREGRAGDVSEGVRPGDEASAVSAEPAESLVRALESAVAQIRYLRLNLELDRVSHRGSGRRVDEAVRLERMLAAAIECVPCSDETSADPGRRAPTTAPRRRVRRTIPGYESLRDEWEE